VKPERRVGSPETLARQGKPSPANQRPALALMDMMDTYLLFARINQRDFDSPGAIIKEVEDEIGPIPEDSRKAFELFCEEFWKGKKEAKERREIDQEMMKKVFAGIESSNKRREERAQGLMPLQTLVSTMSDSITNLSMLVIQLHDRVDQLDTALFLLQTSVNSLLARAR
jgi:hypothetical protein